MKAAKETTLFLVLLIASALIACAPALASSEHVLALETRAEISAESGQFSVEPSPLSPETASRYYDSVGEVASGSPLAPKNAVTFLRRGQIWQVKRDFDKAVSDFTEAIRLTPKNVSGYQNRGVSLLIKRDYDKAIDDFDEAIRIRPEWVMGYYNRGMAWQRKREYDKAIADYNEAIKLDPDFALAFSERAMIMATCPVEEYRNGVQALEDAKKANELSEWKNERTISALAAAYAELGNYVDAMKYQEKAIALETHQDRLAEYRRRLKLYKSGKPYRDDPKD